MKSQATSDQSNQELPTACIFSLPLEVGNYGGILQAVALSQTLRSLGFKTYYDKPSHDRSGFLEGASFFIKQAAKSLVGRWTQVHALTRSEERSLRKLPVSFAKSHIDQIDVVELLSTTDLVDVPSTLFVFGSDQVWRPAYARDIWRNFGVPLPSSAGRKISYAASFGTDSLGEFTEVMQLKAASALQDFAKISVREDSAIDLVKSLGHTAETHVDPTMLLPKMQYDKMIGEPSHGAPDGVFSYVLDQDPITQRSIELAAQDLGLPLDSFFLPEQRGRILRRKVVPLRSIPDWLRGIRDSAYVITDSFHGCVFSIIFNTPFVVLVNETRGATRFTSLLKTFSLENRIALERSPDSILSVLSTPVDWQPVQNTLEYERRRGIAFLKSNKTAAH